MNTSLTYAHLSHTKTMNIHQIHFQSLPSTQTYLTDNFENLSKNGPHLLITAKNQTEGYGRRGTQWDHTTQGLAMSFTLTPGPIATMSSLEVGVLVVEYFETHHDLKLQLKWPNDLFKDGRKVGGIIMHNLKENQGQNTYACGLGLNIGPATAPNKYHHLNLSVDSSSVAEKVYRHFLENRIADSEYLKQKFLQKCCHLNLKCTREGQDKSYRFYGLGDLGEALLEDDQGLKVQEFSGSLRFEGLGN